MMMRLLFLLLSAAQLAHAALYQAPTDVLRIDYLSNHTRYGPGVCGVTTVCQPTDLYYSASPIASASFHCYDNTTEAEYRIQHGTPNNYVLSPADFSGFTCNFADESSTCGITSRYLGDVRTPTSCVCLDTCFSGPTCTSPVRATNYADRNLNYLACVEPFLAPGSVYDSVFKLFRPPSTASANDYNIWDVNETKCRLYWYADTPLATNREALTTLPFAAKTCPAPCSHFKGGGCPAKEACYRRTSSGSVPVLKNGVYVDIFMPPMDVCCERGWDGFDCDTYVGCSKTGCDHNGTCLSTGRSDTGLEIPLDGADIRCINCDPGWTGTFCNISAPMWTTQDPAGVQAVTSAPARRLLQSLFQDACDIVRKNNTFKSRSAGAIYPEPGRACDCGVQWTEMLPTSTRFRILDMGNYDNDFGQLRHRLLSPIRYPTVSSLFASFTPVNTRAVSSKEEARYLCYQDAYCDGFYSDGTKVAFFTLLANQTAALPLVPSSMHLIDRLGAPTAYTRQQANATLDPEFYCSTYPLQCQSIRNVGGVGNMYAQNLTTAQVAELHYRMFGHQVRNSPNARCNLVVDWLEDVSTCNQPLRCIPGLGARNGTGDQQRCGNLTYIETLNPLLRALERINTFPQPFTATIGTANVISEHGQNNTCMCLQPFRPSNLLTYDDCAVDQCGTGLNQGRVNASHIGLGGGVQACECLGKWYTDNTTCVDGTCAWCQLSRCSNFGTVSQNDTCLCSPAFGGPFCDQPVCNNATTTNLVGLLASRVPQLDCAGFCIPPFEGAFCNVTSCIHGVRSYDGGAECICPENYDLGADGRCADLFCLGGHGDYVGNKTCSCKPPWSGDRCEIDGCAQSLIPGKIGGVAVQNLDDGSWDCSCTWPFAPSFPSFFSPTNQSQNINGLCLSHFCGDWGYPASNWTRPADACTCTLDRVGKPYADYGMGIFTNPLKCTKPTFDDCPKPCVQAECGLTEAIFMTNKTFESYNLEASVTSINGEPFCVCPLSFKYTVNTDVKRKCRPFLPCVANGNQTITVLNAKGEVECLCAGTIETGYYSSSLGTARCDIYHPPPPPKIAINTTRNGTGIYFGDPILSAVNPLPSNEPSSAKDEILGQPTAVMAAVFSLAGLALASAVVTKAAGPATGAASAAAPTTILNVNVTNSPSPSLSSPSPPPPRPQIVSRGTGGKYMVIVLMALLVPVKGEEVLGKPGPSYESLLTDRRRTEWSKVVSRTLQIPTNFGMYRESFLHNTMNGLFSDVDNSPVIEVDLSGYEIDYDVTNSRTFQAVDTVLGRPLKGFGMVEFASFKIKPYSNVSTPVVRVGDQTLRHTDVLMSRMTFDIGTEVDTCWRQSTQTFAPVGLSFNFGCPDGFGRVQFKFIAVWAVNLCRGGNSCGVDGTCFSPAGFTWSNVTAEPGYRAPISSFILNSGTVGELQRSAMNTQVTAVNNLAELRGNARQMVFGCKCNDGYTGQNCAFRCDGTNSTFVGPIPACNGRGACPTPLKTMYKSGTLKTCQCESCKCEDGYAGSECEFAVQTRNFPAVDDYRVCCIQSFGDSITKDCAPRHNPMNSPTRKCTPKWHRDSKLSDAEAPFSERCFDKTFFPTEPFRNHPIYSDFLKPDDVCGEADQGRCWQNQLTADRHRTNCWCNHPGSLDGTGSMQRLRGFHGPQCKTRTCTSKSFLWPPYATQLTTRTVDDPTNLNSRCSGRAAVGHKSLDNDLDSVCDDAFRTTLKIEPDTYDTSGYTYQPDAKIPQIWNNASRELWRYNTPGDCVKCIPGWGMLPIDHRLLKGTEYEATYAVYNADGKPNWNGICSERTWHDQEGNVCGGYGVPIYGETMHLKLKAGGYRSIRSVTGCVCPAGTITLDSGICQRSVKQKDAENNFTVPYEVYNNCSNHGQEVALGLDHSACSCFVNTLYAFNGPYCEADDLSMREYGGARRACLNGQFNYFQGIGKPQVALANNTFALARNATGNDILFRDQVIHYVGRNFPNPLLPSPNGLYNVKDRRGIGRVGTLNIRLTKQLNPTIFDASDTTIPQMQQKLWLQGREPEVACPKRVCHPTNIWIGITTSNGTEAFGEFDSHGYLDMYSYPFQDERDATAWNHFLFRTGATAVFPIFIDRMPDPVSGKAFGFLDLEQTYRINTKLFYRYAFTSRTSADVLAILKTLTRGTEAPPVMLAVRQFGGTIAYGEFDALAFSIRYPDRLAPHWPNYLIHDAVNPALITDVFLRQELRMQAEEILGQNYNQFTCSCTRESLEQGRVSQDNKCIIGCASRALDPNDKGPCSGKGTCRQKPNSWDYGCICDQEAGVGGAACNVTVLKDTLGQVCGGADRGTILFPKTTEERQKCDCKKELGYEVKYPGSTCKEGDTTGNCAFTGLCVFGNADCSHTGANLCTRPGIQGACTQNPIQGDYYCFCRPGAFEGTACDKATTPALRTVTGALLSCSGRGTPDPEGTGFCLCNAPYVGYACEIDPTNRPCTFSDGSQGQAYVDGESNGLELVFN